MWRENNMKKYLIYTTAQVEPFEVETDRDLISKFNLYLENGWKDFEITHIKENMMGKFKYRVILNVDNIVSITTSEKL